MMSWFKNIFAPPKIEQNLSKTPNPPLIKSLADEPNESFFTANRMQSSSKNLGQELDLFFELYSLSSTRCWDFKDNKAGDGAYVGRDNPIISFDGHDSNRPDYFNPDYRIVIIYKRYKREISYDFEAYKKYPMREKHLAYSGYEWLVELIARQREHIKKYNVQKTYYQDYLDWRFIQYYEAPFLSAMNSNRRFFKYSDDCVFEIDPIVTIGTIHKRYNENGLWYISSEVISTCDATKHPFLSSPHERIKIDSIESHWIEETVNTYALAQKNLDNKIISHMEHVFEMWEKYTKAIIQHDGLLPAKITNFKSYCEFCESINLNKSEDSYRIENYLRNVGKYEK